LEESPGVRNFRTTATDGKSHSTKHDNLDVIISVGYRVKSLRGTQFRPRSLAVLREYLVKGFAMNDNLLKNRRRQLPTGAHVSHPRHPRQQKGILQLGRGPQGTRSLEFPSPNPTLLIPTWPGGVFPFQCARGRASSAPKPRRFAPRFVTEDSTSIPNLPGKAGKA
jgi:hypothetical protein